MLAKLQPVEKQTDARAPEREIPAATGRMAVQTDHQSVLWSAE
ncbi:MAG: hypothetical protein ACJ8AJ_06035 [Gemmatimonadaceae bacterium]